MTLRGLFVALVGVSGASAAVAAEPAVLRFRSEPPGATIHALDRKDRPHVCETPCELTLIAGDVTLFARAPGRIEGTQKVQLASGESREVLFELKEEPAQFDVDMRCGEREGVRVFLNGTIAAAARRTGTIATFLPRPGTHHVRVEADGCVRQEARISLRTGEPAGTNRFGPLEPEKARPYDLARELFYSDRGHVAASFGARSEFVRFAVGARLLGVELQVARDVGSLGRARRLGHSVDSVAVGISPLSIRDDDVLRKAGATVLEPFVLYRLARAEAFGLSQTGQAIGVGARLFVQLGGRRHLRVGLEGGYEKGSMSVLDGAFVNVLVGPGLSDR